MRSTDCEESESFELETKMMNIQIANLEWFMIKRGLESMSSKVFALQVDIF